MSTKSTHIHEEMSGIAKIFKPSSPGMTASATKSSIATKNSVATTATTTSSVNPRCEYVSRQKYIRDRRLVTRTDVRQRMSVWHRLFSCCSGGKKRSLENESIFTVRS